MTSTPVEPIAHKDTPHDKAVRPVLLFGMPYPITLVGIATWTLFFLSVDPLGLMR
jgi:hypothetical protein